MYKLFVNYRKYYKYFLRISRKRKLALYEMEKL